MRADIDIAGKRCLITGVTGFLGANLARDLLARGALVHGTVRDGSDLWRIRDITKNMTISPADLADRISVEQTMRLAEPEYIFNTAVGRGNQSVMEAVNVTGARNLIEATKDLKYRRLVHFGSSMEYGQQLHPLEETMPAAPKLPFAVTKAAATNILTNHARASGKPVVVLRIFSVYGFWEGPARLIPTAFMAARTGRALPLTESGYRRDLIFVEDVIEAALLAATIDLPCGEIINIGTGRQHDNIEVVDAVGGAAGKNIDILEGAYAPHASDTGHWVADINKAKHMLRWQPRHSLEAGLARTASWFDEHADLYEQEAITQVGA